MNIVIGLLTVILVVVCLLIVLIVMMQRPKQEGLGAAFGGGMTDQMFGAQTTNVLQKGTVYLAVMFFGITLLLSVLVARRQNKTAALGGNLADPKAEAAAAEGAASGDGGTGAQLLSELPLNPESGTPDSTGEAAIPPATGEEDAANPGTGDATEAPASLEATPAEPAPSTIDDAAPLPDSGDDPADAGPTDTDTSTPSAGEAPAENTDAAGETPNL
jgi:preprotein translocase subunit SecG